MSTALAEPEAPTAGQQLVSKPETSALFMANRSNLRLVKRPIRLVRDAEGNAVDQTPGETVEFVDGVLRVPLDPDAEVRLSNGETAPAGEILKWLEAHRFCGDWQEGFWRVDPTAPPASKDELETLQGFAMELDLDGLMEFVRQERAAWNRPELLEIAEGSIARIEAKTAQLHAAHEAALAAARAEGEKQALAKLKGQQRKDAEALIAAKDAPADA